MKIYVLVAFIAAVVTFSLCALVRKLARDHHWYPKIRERDVHKTPTPRLGGVAMFGGVLVAGIVAMCLPWFSLVFESPWRVVGVLAASFLIVLIGVLDDIFDLDWMLKLGAQIAAGLCLALSGIAFTSLPIAGITVGSKWMSVALTVLAVVLVMNAVNFMDGLDGLVAGIGIIGNGAFLIYSYLLTEQLQTSRFSLAALVSAIVVGICVGFLPYNWNPASLFMGDGGALLVGLLMAVSTISVTGEVDPMAVDRRQLAPAFLPLMIPLAVLALPLIDFLLAVTRRLRARKSIFTADRKHLHHRMLDMGHSQRHAVLVLYAWATLAAAGGLALYTITPTYLSWIAIACGFVVCLLFTIWPRVGSRKAREVRAQTMPSGSGTEVFDPLDSRGEEEAEESRDLPPGAGPALEEAVAVAEANPALHTAATPIQRARPNPTEESK